VEILHTRKVYLKGVLEHWAKGGYNQRRTNGLMLFIGQGGEKYETDKKPYSHHRA
jgi:hypothetical protein